MDETAHRYVLIGKRDRYIDRERERERKREREKNVVKITVIC